MPEGVVDDTTPGRRMRIAEYGMQIKEKEDESHAYSHPPSIRNPKSRSRF
jgi:hypothetical protein